MKELIIIALLFVNSSSTILQSSRKVCSAKGNASIQKKYTLYGTSGDPGIDQITTNELLLLQQSFLVYPVFFFYDDYDGKNAKATDEVIRTHGPDGTVIFGKRLFNSEAIRSWGGTSIPIIIAHEYAHIADFKFGQLAHVSTKKRELFADVFAGMYIYVRQSRGWYTDLNAVNDCFKSLADTDFGSDSHGTANERIAALEYGYNYMAQNALFGVGMRKALDVAENYVDEYVEDFDEEEDVKSVDDDD
ncbi:MAG TPA: hypothetical protein VIM75_13500 [Ohtaekwangia sp.]|uniref:hypothetical protein n=1 Tax=Ohtaekwangia sp. TaxID=2066019 RepID=UPI002F94E649